jgi:L-iditol 2-dehydrogenase
MKAMMLTGIRAMALRDVPAPELRGSRDVRICGSDVHYYRTGRIGSQVVQYPFTVGHECAGVVEAVGRDVTRLRVGDRVAVDPAVSCGSCDQCRAGRPHTCRHLRFLGCPGQMEGCLAEFLVMPETCCFPVPPGLSLAEAILSEPLAIGLYALRLAALPAGARIAVLGAGPIGLSVLLPAVAQGVERAYVTDKVEARLAAARAAGATWAGSPDGADVVAAIQACEPLQLDAVFECCGQQEALDQAVELLKPGGRLLLLGIPAEARVSFGMDHLRRKELCLQNVRRQNRCTEAALEAMAAGVLKPGFMATHRFPLERAPEAFDMVEHYRDGVIKALVTFAQGRGARDSFVSPQKV